MEYRFEILDLDDNVTTKIQSLNNVSFSYRLNNFGTMNFSLYQEQIPFLNKFLLPEKSQIRIYRNDINVWSGLLKDRSKGYASQQISFTAETYETILEGRNVEYLRLETETNKAQLFANIVYGMETMGGYYAFGLQLGNIEQNQTGVLTAGEEFQNKNILKIARELAKSEYGFDFEITPDKKINTFSPQKGEFKPNVILELDKNVKDINERTTGNKIVNKVIALGANGLRYTAEDLGSQQSYRTREKIINLRDVTQMDLLRQIANRMLLDNSSVQINFDISLMQNPKDLDISDFGVGDYLRIIAKSENKAFNIDTYKRVKNILIFLDNEYNESYGLTFFEE